MKTETEIAFCIICGKKFKVKRKGMKLCSEECHKKRKKDQSRKYYLQTLKSKPQIKKFCIVCGKECPLRFMKFCSSSCRYKDFRAKHPIYRENEKNIQKLKAHNNQRARMNDKIKAKTKYIYLKVECQLCGSKKRLEFHHYSVPYYRDRFLVLCIGCHDKIHYAPLTKKELFKIDSFIKLREEAICKMKSQ
jgi:predicted nucleic acid-binding Zn ribbon protein